MNEIIVRVARAIASRPRLRILSWLAQHDEGAPTTLAAEFRVPLSAISTDLRILSTAGVIRGRRSGARCFYEFRSPYKNQTFSGSLSGWLRGLLKQDDKGQDNRGLQEVRDCSAGPHGDSPHKMIFEAATAFTDLRRLQILRYLGTSTECSVEDLVNDLHMSPDAAGRHIAKLRRRGFVSVERRGDRTLSFHLALKQKTPIHARIYEIIRATWEER